MVRSLFRKLNGDTLFLQDGRKLVKASGYALATAKG